VNPDPGVVSFETFADLFIERYSKDRGKASWRDDEDIVKQLASLPVIDNCPLGDKPIQAVTEDDRGCKHTLPRTPACSQAGSRL
jgi:hypothetical protein